MRAVLLFHVGPHLHALRANLLSETEQGSRRRLNNSLISHVSERKPLDAHKIQSRRMRDRHRFHIRPRQHLNPAGQSRRVLHGAANDRHHRHDFRAHRAAQVRRVVHVLNHNSMHARLAVHLRLAHRQRFNLPHAPSPRRRPGQRAQMNHRNHRFRTRKQRILRRHGKFIIASRPAKPSAFGIASSLL